MFDIWSFAKIPSNRFSTIQPPTHHSPVNNIPMYSYRLSVIIYLLLALVSHCFIKLGFPLNVYGGALVWLWRSIIVIIHSISVQAVVWEGSCTLREWFIQVKWCSVGLNFYSLPQEQIRGFVNTIWIHPRCQHVMR